MPRRAGRVVGHLGFDGLAVAGVERVEDAGEAQAAHRIFGLLPSDLSDDLRATWEEFERAETPDAIFAKSLDRVQPVVQNLACDGGTWVEYKVTYEQLVARVGQKVARGAPKLWDWISEQARAWFS